MYSSLRVFGFVFVYVCICVYVCAFVRILYNVLFAPLREALLLLLRSIFPGLLVDPPLPVPPYTNRLTLTLGVRGDSLVCEPRDSKRALRLLADSMLSCSPDEF